MKPLLRGVLLAALLASVEAARADWVVQLAAFADSAFLRQMAESIRKSGFPVTTEPLAQENGPALTRLLAGPYETKAEAQAAAVQLAARGWPGYLKHRTEAGKPAPRPAAPRPAAPPPAARAPSKSRASVPPVPVPSGPTPSAQPAPSSRATPSLQPAQPAEPPPTPPSRSPESSS